MLKFLLSLATHIHDGEICLVSPKTELFWRTLVFSRFENNPRLFRFFLWLSESFFRVLPCTLDGSRSCTENTVQHVSPRQLNAPLLSLEGIYEKKTHVPRNAEYFPRGVLSLQHLQDILSKIAGPILAKIARRLGYFVGHKKIGLYVKTQEIWGGLQ